MRLAVYFRIQATHVRKTCITERIGGVVIDTAKAGADRPRHLQAPGLDYAHVVAAVSI
jgi:hypothetical protein